VLVNSHPDLNRMDYSIWDAVVSCKSKNFDHLKRALNSCWYVISEEVINGAIGQWFKQLLLVVHLHYGTVDIISVNSVTSAACKPFLSQIA